MLHNSIFQKPTFKINIQWGLAALCAFVIFIHWPFLDDTYIPTKDSMYVFQVFNFFYNELFFHGDLAQWMPYYSYGLPANYHQLVCLTPVSYLALLLGWIVKANNVLLLFKISVLGEQLVFLTGVYILSQRLFRRRLTVFLVCLGAIAGGHWLESIYFHLRAFYLFPFVVYFMLLFFELKKPQYFWAAALSVAVSLLGVPPYFMPLWFYVFLAIFLPLIIFGNDSLRPIFKRSTASVMILLAFAVLCFSYFYQLWDLQSFADMPTRRSLQNSLGVFLNYGAKFESQGHLERGHYLKGLLLGQMPQAYIGLLLVVFYVWALIKERSKIFLSLLGASVALMWLSLGGVFSVFCFYLPGLAYFRHIDAVYLDGIVKVFILLCAGFGCEHFLKESLRTKIGITAVILLGFVFVLDSSRATADALYASWVGQTLYPKGLFAQLTVFSEAPFRIGIYFAAIVLSSVLLIYAKRLKKNAKNIFPSTAVHQMVNFIFVAVLAVDIASFHCASFKKSFQLPESYRPLLYVFQAHQPEFQMQRRTDPELTELSFFAKKDQFENLGSVIPFTARQKDAYEVAGRWNKWATSCVESYDFFQLDPFYPQFRTDFIPRRLSELLSIDQDADFSKILNNLILLNRVVGFNYPKIQLIAQAASANGSDDTKEKVYRLAKTGEAIVLGGYSENADSDFEKQSAMSSGSKIRVRAFSANTLIVDADVATKDGAWLYYSDSFHPGWKATVNGKKTSVYEANLAFKAIHLESGKSSIRFYFRNGFSAVTSHTIAFFGLMTGLVQSMALVWNLFFSNNMVRLV